MEFVRESAFGVGFKAVYVYTDAPEIYSGQERFCIRNYIEPEAIDSPPEEILALVEDGKTVFRLPFRKRIGDKEISLLRDKLSNLGLRSLLFLRNIHGVEWQDEKVCYRSQWLSYDHIPNAQRVVVSVVQDEQELDREEWLVFSKSVMPTGQVIEDLLADADDDDERERIQRSMQKMQSLDVAFKMIDGQISAADNSYIFAFLPTLHESHLRFVVQARYQTTPARDRIPENDWNSWLIGQTAGFMPEILAQIKEAGLLLPSFLEVLPLVEDDVPAILSPIRERIEQTFKEGEFVPTDEAGYSNPRQVFYPHADALRRLLSEHDLEELTEVKGAKWLHPGIGDNEKYRRRFGIIKSAGVREVGASQLMTWLAKQGVE